VANPGNPTLSPHAEGRKAGTCHTIKTVERQGGTGKGISLREEPPSFQKR